MLTLASCGLIGVAVSPDYWYPVLWVSPLLILVSLQVLFSEENLLQKLEQGDWHVVTLPALAALVCGFFWEMWNHYSYPKWAIRFLMSSDLRFSKCPCWVILGICLSDCNAMWWQIWSGDLGAHPRSESTGPLLCVRPSRVEQGRFVNPRGSVVGERSKL